MKKLLPVIIFILLVALVIFTAFYLNKPRSTVINKDSAGTPSMQALINQAKDLEAKGQLLEQKSLYQKLISAYSNSKDIPAWQKKLDDINIKLIFSPAITPKSVAYDIKTGDTLTSIAKEHKTTVELIKKTNNMVDDKILPGKRIKIWTAPFTIVVDKSQNTLMLKSEEEIIKIYIVSTGANNCTPVGNFKIVNKIPSPTWYKAGIVVPSGSPENVLGSHWMGFNLPGYGIHGTVEPQSLGRQVTQGCVRMANNEVEELYTLIPVGTEVVIVD